MRFFILVMSSYHLHILCVKLNMHQEPQKLLEKRIFTFRGHHPNVLKRHYDGVNLIYQIIGSLL